MSPVTPKCRKRGALAIVTPDPNANRAIDYPTEWTVHNGNQTAKCGVCKYPLKGTQYHFRCSKCNKVICQPCWDGQRFNGEEERFEGRLQNEDGCWCRFDNLPDPRHKTLFDARTKRIQARQDAQITASFWGHVVEPAGSEDGSQKSSDAPPAKRLRTMDRSSEEGAEQAGEGEALHDEDDTVPAEVSDEQSDDDAMDVEDTLLAQLPPILHLQDKTTVIADAGVVGLSIARALAVDARHSGTRHKIVVVEANKTYASHASGACAGWINKHGMAGKLLPLYGLSLEGWADILAADGVAEQIHHQPNNIVHVKSRGYTHRPQDIPSWYSGIRPQDTFKNIGSGMGKISSAKFCDWLYRECLSYGVVFHFSQMVTNHVRFLNPENLNRVELSSTKPGNKSKREIPCYNLVLAAGPWTTSIFDEEFFRNNLKLENNLERYDWIHVPKQPFVEGDDLGLLLREDVAENAIMSAQPEASRILIAKSTFDYQHNAVPRQSAIDGVQPYSTKILRSLAVDRMESFSSEGLEKGSSYVETALGGLPHIGKVHPLTIDDRAGTFPTEAEFNVYLCYGFGKFGTTLAPGAARALCRMICGEEAGIDLSPYACPEPKEVRVLSGTHGGRARLGCSGTAKG